MKFNELTHMMQKPEPKPDTYEAGMALNQLLKIGTHAIKIHNMIDDDAEMESWVAKKIDLASNYVKSVHGYTAGSKAGTYDDGGMTEDANSLTDQQKKALDMVQAKYGNRVGGNGDSLPKGYMLMRLQTGVGTDGIDDDELEAALKKYGYDSMYDAEQADDDFFDKIHNKEHLPITMNMIDALSDAMGSDFMDDKKLGDAYDYLYNRDESVSEDAGEKIANMAQNMSKDEFMSHADELGLSPEEAAEHYEKMSGGAHAGKFEDAGDMDLIGDGAENLGLDPNKFDYYYDTSGAGYGEVRTKSGKSILQFEYDRDGDAEVSTMDNKTIANIKQGEQLPNNVTAKLNMIKEDAGEGHMSKSQLYQTAKMAIELLDMIKKGDDLEGWVQTKLNLAADYLQAVYHYEDYQKLNPYREELDISLMQRHAGIIQKHLDEILERKCRAEDVDTKPGMMRILKKRVNEVEKEIAKENRKESQETKEAVELEEGIKEWGKRLAMAGVIVAGLAGVNSINNAIDNSIPAIKAMNTALEMAQDAGNDELAKMIEKDLSDAKVRLNSGKDLSHVADLQDKYAKFMKTEGLAYESKLTVALKQQLK